MCFFDKLYVNQLVRIIMFQVRKTFELLRNSYSTLLVSTDKQIRLRSAKNKFVSICEGLID